MSRLRAAARRASPFRSVAKRNGSKHDSRMRLNSHTLCELVYGGAILGAGGGGSIEAGLVAGRRALAAGTPRLIPLSALAPDACLVTFSNVGTVMGKGGVAAARDYHTRALELFSSLSKTRPDGIIPSEVGAL